MTGIIRGIIVHPRAIRDMKGWLIQGTDNGWSSLIFTNGAKGRVFTFGSRTTITWWVETSAE
jgi:hypothetical protein